MLLPQDTDTTRMPKLHGLGASDKEYQIVPEFQASKFIKNLGDNTELDTEAVGKEVIEYLKILTTPKETKLAEASDKVYKRYIAFKNARLDATKVNHPKHRTLHFIAYAENDCLMYHNTKENAYFPRYARPIYISRTIYQLYILTEISEKVESSGVDSTSTNEGPEDTTL